jgi:predicted metal-dependent hydrolase
MTSPSETRQLQLTFEDPESIFADTHRTLKPRTPVPKFQVEFFPFAGVNHTAYLKNGVIRVRISDILQDAPLEIIRSVAFILLAKLYRKTVDVSVHENYRSYILCSEIQERARVARSQRGRQPRRAAPRGRHVNLEASFERVNQKYFNGEFNRPAISWSSKRSRYILGRYDALHHTIFVSRVFDSLATPDYVIDYIVFHEMLHAKHRSQVQDGRCIVHTREFKADEQKFAEFERAKRWLKSI